MSIKPIETHYNGYKFRSRLEARWAVFFDSLGVEYEYEPEGYSLGNGEYYLPDFRVKCYGTRGCRESKPFDLFIEVKGKMTLADANKIKRFSGKDQHEMDTSLNLLPNPVLIVDRIPGEGCCTDSYEVKAYELMNGWHIYPFNYELIDGDYFAAYPAADEKGHFYLMGDDSHYVNDKDIPRVEAAYRKARQARFEHGETPEA